MRALRVSLLLALLVAVIVYAAHDVLSRRARNEWQRTLDVAFVVVTEPGVDTRATAELRVRLPELSHRLASELHRYRPRAPAPFAFVAYGPVSRGRPVPELGGDGLGAAARYAWDLRGFTHDLDERAGVPSRGFDMRVYLVVSPPTKQALVDGSSEHGGRIAIARAELDHETVDVALIVAAHELFHTVGAEEHYGADGRVLVPDGLAEPELEPTFPQRRVEIMARNRPVSAAKELRPKTLDELAVGPSTAREIGWTAR